MNPALPKYGPDPTSAWLEIDWREHQRWEVVEGSPVNVIDIGEGPPILWIHGLGGSWQNWLEQLPVFAADHRCVAFDLPGFGASPRQEGEISIPGFGKIAEGLCAKLGLERPAVVGNSMGGFVACELAVTHPERVDRLVLVSSAGLSSEQLHRRPLLTAARMGEFGAALVGTHSEKLSRRPRSRKLLAYAVFRHPDRIPAPLMAEQLRGAGKPGVVGALDALMTYRIRDRLSEIARPTLIVWGSKDMLVPVSDAKEFERLIDGSRRIVFDDTGHVPQMERPQAFNDALAEFLAEEPGEVAEEAAVSR